MCVESVQDAVGQQVKLCVLKKVNLEVKGDKLENRILVSTMCFYHDSEYNIKGLVQPKRKMC